MSGLTNDSFWNNSAPSHLIVGADEVTLLPPSKAGYDTEHNLPGEALERA